MPWPLQQYLAVQPSQESCSFAIFGAGGASGRTRTCASIKCLIDNGLEVKRAHLVAASDTGLVYEMEHTGEDILWLVEDWYYLELWWELFPED